ncbi:Legume-like lectin family protein [Oesophagostomum dentatum]|uniref:Legume-like lectin family protein n=1 Tax=Oesophagostomum dentatum TaxID=61180 RepID=A0A0B1STF9_OESDE|nr:Legume-like lectin family protein [Oesophagostomum dentatum]
MYWIWGLLLFAVSLVNGQMPIFRKFEYKHSFRAPNLAQRDGSIPFWMVSALAAIDFIIAMSIVTPFAYEFSCKSALRSGSARELFSRIMVSGDAIASGEQLRLAPSMRSRKGIVWNKRPMQESENFQQTPRYELCMRAENILLPRNGYFGMSAATGGLADDHDVLDFSVYSIHTDGRSPTATHMPQDEKSKYDEEFERQMKEFEAERAKFKEQHPEKAKDDDYDEAKYFEDATARELRQLFESQSHIYELLQRMETKLNQIQSGGVVQVQPGQAAPAGAAAGGGILPHEKNEIIQSLRDLSQSLRDTKNYVNEIFTKTYNMEQKLSQGGVQVAGGATIDQSMHQKVDSLLNEVRTVRANQLQQSGGGGITCPNIACLSSSLFLTVIFIQAIAIIAMVYIRSVILLPPMSEYC